MSPRGSLTAPRFGRAAGWRSGAICRPKQPGSGSVSSCPRSGHRWCTTIAWRCAALDAARGPSRTRAGQRHALRPAPARRGDLPQDLPGALLQAAAGRARRPVRAAPQPGRADELAPPRPGPVPGRARGGRCGAAPRRCGGLRRSEALLPTACGSRAAPATTGCSVARTLWCIRPRRRAPPPSCAP